MVCVSVCSLRKQCSGLAAVQNLFRDDLLRRIAMPLLLVLVLISIVVLLSF
jgi:hypothetical protein